MGTNFSYGIRSDADRARLQQQIGDYPPPHFFRKAATIPQCAECLAVRDKPWHLSRFWIVRVT